MAGRLTKSPAELKEGWLCIAINFICFSTAARQTGCKAFGKKFYPGIVEPFGYAQGKIFFQNPQGPGLVSLNALLRSLHIKI
jgi:hypothetical protein